MKKRELLKLIAIYECTLDELRNGKHCVVKLTNRNNIQFVLTLPKSCSDHRSMRNLEATLKRNSIRTEH